MLPNSRSPNYPYHRTTHGLINYNRHQSKMSSSKILTCKGTMRQMFIRVYRLEIQSVMLVLSTHLCEGFAPLFGSNLSPPPFPVWISILYSRMQCVRGEIGVLGLRQINTCRKVQLQVNLFRCRHFALPSMSLIFLRYNSMLNILLSYPPLNSYYTISPPPPQLPPFLPPLLHPFCWQ